MQKVVSCLQNEKWYVGVVEHGYQMPIDPFKQTYLFDGRRNMTVNQLCSLALSDQGRYLYTEGGCLIEIGDGKISFQGAEGEIDYADGLGNLKTAYLTAANKHFFRAEKTIPPVLCLAPQYCTWVEMLRSVSEEKILRYADGIQKAGLPTGCLIVDDGWMRAYGEWDFTPEKFSDPEKMIKTLHETGFSVVLWLCPFVDQTAKDFSALEQAGALVRDKNGKVAFREWWNGKSALLDMTHPVAVKWITDTLARLQALGVDGFKFDAGDPEYYEFDDTTYAPTTPNGQCALWAEFASRYEIAELRACIGLNGLPIAQRLCDKNASWDEEKGIGSLIPNMATIGLAGYAYSCPDMVGGGQEADFQTGAPRDRELFIRSCQCVALMPMMQFSYAIWEHYDDAAVKKIVLECANFRVKHKDYFLSLLEEAREAFAPMLRHMEYEFSGEGFSACKDQFMLGEKFLACPVLCKGQTKRAVKLPKNTSWEYIPTGEIFEGGKTVEVDAPIGVLPYFKRLEK